MKRLYSKTLDTLFRISRALGIAPVSFADDGLQLSRPLQLCSSLFFTILNGLLLLGLVIDLTVEPRRSIRVPTLSSYLIWITNVIIVTLIIASGVYFQTARVKCISHVLTRLEKIKKNIPLNSSNHTSPNKSSTAILFLLITIVVLTICDLYKYTENAIIHDKEVTVLILYTSFYYEFVCVSVFECQFLAIAFEVQHVLFTITKSLHDLYNIVQNKKPIKEKLWTENIYFPKAVANNNRINNVVDKLTTFIAIPDNTEEGLEGKLHDLALAYGYTCDVIRKLNRGFGFQLLLILMSFFMQLVITPYYFIDAVYTSSRDVFLLFLQVMWCLYHLVNMWCVVEPAYLTQLEIEKTEVLINRFHCHIKPCDPMYGALKLFSRQLAFTTPSYTPLGVCTLSRKLCVTVLGTVTTYLVIVLQFRANEK